MNIQILSTEVFTQTSKAGKPYEQLVVAYKNFEDGKVASKTIMPFGLQKDTFTTLKNAKAMDTFNVDVQKNEAGYNDWVRATRGVATASVQHASSARAATTPGSNGTTSRGFETPEERAKKQVYIIRQSSLSTAVSALTVGRKTEIKREEIVELAKYLESYVFGTDANVEEITKRDIESIEEDIPF